MATTELKESLTETFYALPEAIQSWLASRQATIFISEINKKLGLKEEKRGILPRLIMRLILKDLEPANFINELSAALNMNYQAAKALVQEIEEKIFNPIAAGLKRDVGLDVKLIYFGKPSERGPVKLEEMPIEPPQIEIPAIPQPFTRPFAAPAPKPPMAAAGTPAETRRPTPAMPISPRTPEPEEPEIGEASAYAESTADKPALIYKKGTFGRVPIAKSGPVRPLPPPIRTPVAPMPQQSPAQPPKPPLIETKPELKLKVEAPLPPTTAPLEINRPATESKPAFPPKPLQAAGGPAAGLGPKPTPPAGRPTSGPNIFSGQDPFPKATKIVHYDFQAASDKLQSEIRVVHYSNFLTRLDELGLEKKPKPKKEDVILKGNVVDLRFT